MYIYIYNIDHNPYIVYKFQTILNFIIIIYNRLMNISIIDLNGHCMCELYSVKYVTD